MRKKYVLIALTAVLIVGGTGAVRAAPTETPRPVMADAGEAYSLAAQWKFLPGDDLSWASPDFDDNSWAARGLTRLWPRAGYPQSNQIAWYRLTHKFDLSTAEKRDYVSHLGVGMGKVMSAYELYAGGRLVGAVGKLPPFSEINYDRTRVFPIPPSAIASDGTLVLALRVWGGSELAVSKWGGGPYEGDFRLGDYGKLLEDSFLSQMPGLVASALFLAFGFYHIYLYQRNRRLQTYLWYGLMALLVGTYGLMVNQWRYRLDWTFVAYEKVEFAAIYLLPAIALQMVWSLLQLPIGRLLRVYQLSFVVIALAVVTVPGLDIHYHTLRPWQLWSIALLAALPVAVIREARAGNAEARTALIGVLIFAAACTNDLLIDIAGWEGTRLVPLGFAAIMLSMAISLANRFTTAFNNLEGEVAQRTSDLRIANRQLALSARVDPLTGLLNRRGLLEEAAEEMHRFLRTGREFSIVLTDLDNFKKFNDQYGHACGDYVLQETAHLISGGVRSMDIVSRWGGEELMLLLPETDSDGAALLVEKLRAGLEAKRFGYKDQQFSVTMTFGIAVFRKDETLDNCIARADTALYRGKDQGRNRVIVDSWPELSSA